MIDLFANGVVVIHVSFVLFLFLGAFAFSRYRWLIWPHASCIVYGILITSIGWSCPLTLLEQWLRAMAGSPVYSGEFLGHYVWSHFGLTGTEWPVGAGLIFALLVANVSHYRSWFRSQSS